MYTDVPIKQVIHSRLGSLVIRSRKLEHKSYSVGRGPEFLFPAPLPPHLFPSFFPFLTLGRSWPIVPPHPCNKSGRSATDWDNRETTICSLLIKIYRWKMSRRRVKKKRRKENVEAVLSLSPPSPSLSLSKRFSPRFLPFETYTGNFKLNTQPAHSLVRSVPY